MNPLRTAQLRRLRWHPDRPLGSVPGSSWRARRSPALALLARVTFQMPAPPGPGLPVPVWAPGLPGVFPVLPPHRLSVLPQTPQ